MSKMAPCMSISDQGPIHSVNLLLQTCFLISSICISTAAPWCVPFSCEWNVSVLIWDLCEGWQFSIQQMSAERRDPSCCLLVSYLILKSVSVSARILCYSVPCYFASLLFSLIRPFAGRVPLSVVILCSIPLWTDRLLLTGCSYLQCFAKTSKGGPQASFGNFSQLSIGCKTPRCLDY